VPHRFDVDRGFVFGFALLLQVQSCEKVHCFVDSPLEHDIWTDEMRVQVLYLLHGIESHSDGAWHMAIIINKRVGFDQLLSIIFSRGGERLLR